METSSETKKYTSHRKTHATEMVDVSIKLTLNYLKCLRISADIIAVKHILSYSFLLSLYMYSCQCDKYNLQLFSVLVLYPESVIFF